MPGIGRINISYHDPELHRILASISKTPVKRIRNEDLAKYSTGTSLIDLKHTNLLLTFGDSCKIKREYTDNSNAFAGQILFSTRNEMISTDGGACTSYMLFCREKKILSAVHVRAYYADEPLFHVNMLMHAYATLRTLAPKDHISAYISGMTDFLGTDYEVARNGYMEQNRRILTYAALELISRGVQVKEINIGYKYDHQEFWLRTGQYKTILSKHQEDQDAEQHANIK